MCVLTKETKLRFRIAFDYTSETSARWEWRKKESEIQNSLSTVAAVYDCVRLQMKQLG